MKQLGTALFRLLLRLLPDDLVREHGPAMAIDLEEAIAAEHSTFAKARIWFSAVVDLIRRSVYEHWLRRDRQQRRSARIAELPSEIRMAVRGYLHRPATTVLLVVTLTLGMAATLGVFGLINGVLLRPLPFPSSDRLVYLNETAPRWQLRYTGINYGDFNEWRKGVGSAFEAIGVYGTGGVNLADRAGAERAQAAWVSYDLLKALGISPIRGRAFGPDDDRFQGPNVAMLVETAWRVRFGGTPDIIGQSVMIDGVPRTIIGILPREAAFLGDAQVWLPLQGDPSSANQSYSYDGIGRLKPSVDLAAARAVLEASHLPVWAASDTARTVSPVVEPLRERLTDGFRITAMAMGLGAALVLLCGVANVASTMLARALFRRREMAVRMALGAAVNQISRQLLLESLVLAAVAAALGLVLGQWGVTLLARALGDTMPAWIKLEPTWVHALAAVAVTAIAAILFGAAPIRFVRRQDPAAAFGASRAGTGLARGAQRSLRGLVIVEVAMATILLVASGMLYRAFVAVRAVDPGFRTEGVLTFRLGLPQATYPDSTAVASFRRRLTDALTMTPGAEAVGIASCLPLAGCHTGMFYVAEGAPAPQPGAESPVTLTLATTPGVSSVLGLRLIAGRWFREGDGDRGQPVALVSQDFATLHWPGVADPTGRRIRFRGRDSTSWRTVVGVVGNVRHYGLDESIRPTVYLPLGFFNAGFGGTEVAVRVAGSIPAFAGAAVRAVKSVDPSLAVYAVRSMDEAVAESLMFRRLVGGILAFFAVTALVLAIGGLYGVLSYVVGRRHQEIGLRLALGAHPRQVVGLVVRDGLTLAAVGIAVGMPAAIGIGKLIGVEMTGVRIEVPVLLTVTAALLAVASLAAGIPGWRAARVEPRASLSSE